MTFRPRLAATAAILALATAGATQKSDQEIPPWRIDPFSKNDPKILEKAGYISYGPFEFGERGRRRGTTDEIDAALGEETQLLWVETAHFKIACALEAWQVPNDRETRVKIREELTELKAVFPKIKPRTRILSPWLRLHMMAHRAEKHYAHFQKLLGVKDADFPKSQKDVVIGRGRYMGFGPFLGMHEKYLLFVTQERDAYMTYMQDFVGKSGHFGARVHFLQIGSMFYGTSIDNDDKGLRHDTALHGHILFNLTHLFIDGFRHYSYDVPVWINEGLAHYFERQVSEKWNSFSLSESAMADRRSTWRWHQEVRKLVAADKGSPFAKMFTWRDVSQIEFDDHMLLWSRWDFLMSTQPDRLSEFMFSVKGRHDPKTWMVDQNDIPGAAREGLRKAYGLTPISLDEKWREWVLANYPTR